MSSEENKAAARVYFEKLLNAGELSGLECLFLRDARFPDEVYVVTRYRKHPQLTALGSWQVVHQSARSGRSRDPDRLMTLF